MNDLLKAIVDNDFSGFKSLLAGDPGLANARNEQGVSAVLLATYYRRQDFIRELVDAGAGIGIFEAAALGDTARLIELTGRDPQAVNRFSPDGFQPLGLAAYFGQTEAARYLMDHGADLDRHSRNPQDVDPLHSAASSNCLAIAAALIQRGADVNARQPQGYTALHAAAQNGSVEMVRLLVGSGADCMARNDAGKTPKEVVNRRNVETIDALLAACMEGAE